MFNGFLSSPARGNERPDTERGIWGDVEKKARARGDSAVARGLEDRAGVAL